MISWCLIWEVIIVSSCIISHCITIQLFGNPNLHMWIFNHQTVMRRMVLQAHCKWIQDHIMYVQKMLLMMVPTNYIFSLCNHICWFRAFSDHFGGISTVTWLWGEWFFQKEQCVLMNYRAQKGSNYIKREANKQTCRVTTGWMAMNM